MPFVNTGYTKLNIFLDKFRENFVGILSSLLPQTNTKRLENKWNNLNARWEERYGDLTDKFDTLSENDFIKDKEILDKFEALRYIGKFKDCTLIQALNNIEKVIGLINNNIDYIIFNSRITGFTYVLVKDICDFLVLEINKIEKGKIENLDYAIKVIADKIKKLTDLFYELFSLINPILIYITTQKNISGSEKLQYRLKYLIKKIQELVLLRKKLINMNII